MNAGRLSTKKPSSILQSKSPLSRPTITSQADLFSSGPPSYSLGTMRQRDLHLSYSPAFLSFSRRLHNQFGDDDLSNKSDSDQRSRYDSLVPQEEAYLHAV